MVANLSDVHLTAIRCSGYALDVSEESPQALSRQQALDVIARTARSAQAVVVAMSHGTLTFIEPRAPEPSHGSNISGRDVWLVVVDNEKTPVTGRAGSGRGRGSLPTSVTESRWSAIDARTGKFLISSSLLL